MNDDRRKTVRIDETLNRSIKTLAGYMDVRADEVVAEAVKLLWGKHFGKTPMPKPTKKASKSR